MPGLMPILLTSMRLNLGFGRFWTLWLTWTVPQQITSSASMRIFFVSCSGLFCSLGLHAGLLMFSVRILTPCTTCCMSTLLLWPLNRSQLALAIHTLGLISASFTISSSCESFIATSFILTCMALPNQRIRLQGVLRNQKQWPMFGSDVKRYFYIYIIFICS